MSPRGSAYGYQALWSSIKLTPLRLIGNASTYGVLRPRRTVEKSPCTAAHITVAPDSPGPLTAATVMKHPPEFGRPGWARARRRLRPRCTARFAGAPVSSTHPPLRPMARLPAAAVAARPQSKVWSPIPAPAARAPDSSGPPDRPLPPQAPTKSEGTVASADHREPLHPPVHAHVIDVDATLASSSSTSRYERP